MSLESKYGETKEWPAKLNRQKHERQAVLEILKHVATKEKKTYVT
jgi:hypothetical protein